MGILNVLHNVFRRSSSNDQQEKPVGPRYGTPFFPILNSGGDPMNVSTVYACVKLLSEKVASLPLLYQKWNGEVYEDDVDSNLSYLLRVQPNPYMSAFDFWKLLVSQVYLLGNAYIVPIRSKVIGNDDCIALMIVDPVTVTHNIYTDTYEIHDPIAGVDGIYTEEQIIHIKNYSKDGKTGVSTVSYARMSADIAIASDKETLNRYANGGTVKGLVCNDTSVKGWGEHADRELDKLSYEIESKFRGGRGIAAVHGSAKFQQIAMTSADMEFLAGKKLNGVEICRWFLVPPALVFAEGSNYKSVDIADSDLHAHTLGPLLTSIENELLRKLVPAFLALKRRFCYDRRLLYSCDLLTKADYQTKTIGNGTYTVNEWRRFENKPMVEGGDSILVSTNLTTIENLKEKQNGQNQGNKERI